MPDALDLLKTRRSVKPMELTGPAPSAAEIDTLLGIASRVPDHGKLAPWRFIVFAGEARLAAGEKIAAVFRADRPDATPEQIEFERKRLARAPLVIAVISRTGPHVKIPEWEQQLSAGAAACPNVGSSSTGGASGSKGKGTPPVARSASSSAAYSSRNAAKPMVWIRYLRRLRWRCW